MDEVKSQERDDVHLEIALQTIKDVLWRYEESSEGRRSLYEVLGCLMEDLVREGICAACINDTLKDVFDAVGADLENHRDDEGSVYH